MEKILLLFPCLLAFCTWSIHGDIFTALSDLEDLFETESMLIQTLRNYIKAEEEKIHYLKRYADMYKSQYGKASENVQLYVANPINAYTLVKRLTADWKEVEELINTNLASDYLAIITHIKKNMKFPTDEDLNGAAVALTRLQDTYRLDTSSLARGELNGVKYSSELSAADCFELGRQTYNNGDFYHSQLWMKEADSRLNREAYETIDRSDILEYLAFSSYSQGNITLALELTNKLLELIPNDPTALGNKVYFEDELIKSLSDKKKENDGPLEPLEDSNALEGSPDIYKLESYKQLCRGEVTLSDKKIATLKCRYLNRGNPFLLIAPFKVEEAHHKPDIFIFHDVLSDVEIDTIKRMAQPRLRRVMVPNSDIGACEVPQYRISKSAWLKEHEHKHIADVSQRVTDMTGLTMDTAEELQVINYGIGGHYEPHFDFASRNDKNAFAILGARTGNRIATVLFYMSNVEQGGATVFTDINLALWPKKGAAAFWYNLHPSGDGDSMTRHAACPVLMGSKWVSNKWIHERGQEFLRPCTNERPSEDLMVVW